MKRRRASLLSGIFVSGPWQPEDGDASEPTTVHGVTVIERLGADPQGQRALVRLADGRYAITGSTVAVAPARKLDRYLRRRGRTEPWAMEALELLRRRESRRGERSSS